MKNNKNKFIKNILIEGYGYIYADNNPITEFEVNGEMSKIIWYRQDGLEVNSKYVVLVQYYTEEEKKWASSKDK